jgi:phosphate transport system substrate-binding protein
MSNQKKSGPPPIVYLLAIAVLGFFGYTWLTQQKTPENANTTNTQPTTAGTSFPLPAQVAAGTTIKINGSTSMVQINEALKTGFQKDYAGTRVISNANGSEAGIEALLAGKIDIAALSRPLTATEQNSGLVAIPVSSDAIAIVVGNNNSVRTGLTAEQVKLIFQGQINNWAEVGGKSGTIKVINRPAVSGTSKTFQEIVLQGKPFGSGANFTTLDRDATTPLLQMLKADGIGYATFVQVANQTTIRTLAIDGLTPAASDYPYKRSLNYVYKNPPSEGVKAFLGYANSDRGQKLIPDRVASR